MIQRIQTVYLLIAAILLIFNFFVPYFGIYSGEGVEVNVNGIVVSCVQCEQAYLEELKLPFVGILNFIALILVGLQILMFKNRMNQVKIGYAVLGTISLTFLILAYTLFRILNFITGELEFGYFFGIPSLIGVFVLVLLANHNINKDEEMVRSMHRLR